jgi:transcriptional regulator with GAF, ATPase, and Fis domain
MPDAQPTRAQRHIAQLNALLTLSQALAQAEDEPRLGYEMAKHIESILPVSQLVMLKGSRAAHSMELLVRWESGMPHSIRRDQAVQVDTDQTLVQRIGLLEQVAFSNDFALANPPVRGLLGAPSKSGMAAVLHVGGEPVGVLVIEAAQPDAYDDTDQSVFDQVVMQAEQALTRLQVEFGMQRMALTTSIVNSVGQRIQGETSALGVVNNGALATLRALNAKRVVIKLGTPPSEPAPEPAPGTVNGSA